MGNYTYVQARKRTQYLRGETDFTVSSANTVIDDHILFSIRDIVNAFPFSWNIKTSTITLLAGAAAMPVDYNPQWKIHDARIVSSLVGGDSVFTECPIPDRNKYQSGDFRYYLTYNTTTNLWTFNSPTQTGTVTIFYWFIPADPSADSDVILVPDGEAVAYLAASKMWIGDERNTSLKQVYEQDASKRIQAMWENDLSFGPIYSEGTVIDANYLLNQQA